MVGKLEAPGSHYLACSWEVRELFAQLQGKERLIAQQEPTRAGKTEQAVWALLILPQNFTAVSRGRVLFFQSIHLVSKTSLESE